MASETNSNGRVLAGLLVTALELGYTLQFGADNPLDLLEISVIPDTDIRQYRNTYYNRQDDTWVHESIHDIYGYLINRVEDNQYDNVFLFLRGI